jgi:membrane protease YdiL (CAAX protease family)
VTAPDAVVLTLLSLVALWPAAWRLFARRLRRGGLRGPRRRLAGVLAYDLATWTLALVVLLVAGLPMMPPLIKDLPAVVELPAAAVIGTALYAMLARGSVRAALRGLRPRRRTAVHGAVLGATALAEEIVWRAFALAAAHVVLGLPVLVALAATSVLFAALHVHAHGARGAVSHLVTGSTFGGGFVLTGSLAAAAAAHITYNLWVVTARAGGQRPQPRSLPRTLRPAAAPPPGPAA